MARVASQRFFFTKNDIFVFFFDNIVILVIVGATGWCACKEHAMVTKWTPLYDPYQNDQRNCAVVSCFSDFNLSGGCFGTDIIQKCTKWSQIGAHGLKIWPIFAKFECVSFLIRENVEKWQYGRNKLEKIVVRENKSLRSYTGHTKVIKNKNIYMIYLNWINLIIYNEI